MNNTTNKNSINYFLNMSTAKTKQSQQTMNYPFEEIIDKTIVEKSKSEPKRRYLGGSMLGGKLSEVGAKTFEALIDAARRTSGRRGASIVENEIQRIVEQTGKTPEEVMQDIIDGKILSLIHI